MKIPKSLKFVRSKFIGESYHQGRIVPRLYIQVAPPSEELADTLGIEEGPYEEGGIIPVVSIVDVRKDVLSPHNRAVIIFTHTRVDQGHFGAYLNNDDIFSVAVPVNDLLMFRMQSRLDEDASIYITMADIRNISIDSQFDEKPILCAILPQANDLAAWERVTHGLMNYSSGIYADEEEYEQAGVQKTYRLSQQELLRMYFNLSSTNSDAAIKTWQSIEAMSERFHAPNGVLNLAGRDGDITLALVQNIIHAYMKAGSVFFENSEKIHETSDVDDMEMMKSFESIISNLNIEDDLTQVDAENPEISIGNRDPQVVLPFQYHINPRFADLVTYIEKTDYDVAQLSKWDLTREGVYARALAEYGFFAIIKTMIIVSMLRADRIAEIHDISLEVALIKSINLSEDDQFPWEISAFTPEIVEYNITNFSRLLGSPLYSQDETSTEYLKVALIEMSLRLHQEAWDNSNLDSRLKNNIKTVFPETAQVRSLFTVLMDYSNAIHEDSDPMPPAFVMTARNAFEMHKNDLEQLSQSVSIMLSSLAENYATTVTESDSSAVWEMNRQTYINKFVGDISGHIIRTL